MPLPKDYYNIVQPTTNQPKPTGTTSLFPELTAATAPMQDDPSAWGSVGDFLWSAGEGFGSGMTWGLTDLAGVTGQDSWQEMSGAEKAGWIMGEGVSFFTPLGPFSLLGKGSQAIAKAGNKFVGKAAKEASETAVANLTAKQSKAVLKAQEKGVNFSDDIVKGLSHKGKDDLGVKWIQDLQATGKAALDASNNLRLSATNSILKAAKASGLKNFAPDDAAKIAEDYVQSLKNGEYVNDVAEWVTRGLKGKFPDTANNFIAKYLGMASQDLMMMGTHSLIYGKIRSLANGEEFDVSDNLSHAALMALGFPLVRKIPNVAGMGASGNIQMRQGFKAYFNQFKKTNYNAIAEEHGDDVVKNLLKVMVRGSKKDLWSRSKLGDTHWKAGGKTYTSAEKIEEAIPNMKMDDVYTLLNKMNRTVQKEIMKKVGPKYIEDTIGSIPRMTVGLVTMNPWIFNKDAWGSMEGPELASHLFMAATMTRSRGAWGHTDARNYMADFTPYHEALQVLGVDTKNVQDVLRFHDGRNPYEGMGLALGTHEVGVELTNIIDTALQDAVDTTTGKDFRNNKHALAADMINVYNVIKKQADPNFSPLKAENLDATTLNLISERLGNIQFADGNSIKNLGFEGTLVRLTMEPAKRGIDLYKNLLGELGKRLGYNVAIGEDGKITGRRIVSNTEKSLDDANTFNRILESLESINEATILDNLDNLDERVNYEKIVKKSGLTEAEFNLETRRIVDDAMEVLGREYDDKNIYRDPVSDNPMWEFFKQAKNVEAAERVYNIVQGKFPAGDPSKDINLTTTLDQLFMIDGRYAESIDVYKTMIKELVKGDDLTDKEIQANDDIILNLNDLRELFDLRKAVVGTTNKNPKGTISAEGISIAKEMWKSVHRSLPTMWKQNWSGHTKQLYIERIFRGKGFDSRAVNLVKFLADHNLATPNPEGKIAMPSLDAFMAELKHRGLSPKNMAKYETALKTIKKVLGEDAVTEMNYMWTESGKRQMDVVDIDQYLKAAKMLGNEMYSDLLVNTQAVLGEIAAVSSGSRKRIHEIHNDITNLLDTLDPNSNKRPVDDPIAEIQKLKQRLKELETVASSDNVKNDIGEAIMMLHNITDAIDSKTKRFNITPKRLENLTNDEKLMGDTYGIHSNLTEPLQLKLNRIFSAEVDAINELSTLVVRLENIASAGKAGLGLSKSDVSRIIEDMSRQWFEKYQGKKGNSVKVLSELITEVNEKGFFQDAVQLLESVNERINREIIIKNEHHPLNADGIKMAEALEAGWKTHEHHRSVNEILSEYGLVENDGTINERFKNELVSNPYRALIDHVRPAIYGQEGKSNKEKASEWRQFKEKDAIELITNIENSLPINKVKILGITEDGKSRGIIEFNNNSPSIKHPNTQYMVDKGYKVHYLDDTIAADVGFGDGKLRNASIDNYNADQIQVFLNEAIRTDKITREILDGFKSIDPGLKEKDIRKMLENPTEYVFYVRLSPQDKLMFIASKKNLKILNDDFASTYDKILNSLSGKSKDTFKHMFEDLLTAPNTDRATVQLKMMLPYISEMGRQDALVKMINEYSGQSRPSALAKIQANMYKRGFLSDGGTTQPVSKGAMRWASMHHPNNEVRDIAKSYLAKDGYVAQILDDGASEGSDGRGHPLNIETMELGQLQIVGNQASGMLKELAIAQQKNLGENPSLLSSLLDGGKFASERLMKLVMAQKGMLDVDFSQGPNGAKTIIFSVGDNQLLGKGFLIYHPEVAKYMPKDVDIILGDSSAKNFSGESLDTGNPIEAQDLSGAGTAWQSSLNNSTNRNKMKIPIESIGVSFTSKNESGVAISPSVFDFQSGASIKDAIVWMGFENKLKSIAVEWNSVHKDGAKLANWLYETGEASGNPLDKGDIGLTKLLFSYGSMPNAPYVQKALRRLLRSSNYKHLSKVPNQQGGEDNFIVPNINGDLSVPIYADLHTTFLQDHGIPGQSVVATGDKFSRVAVNFGGIGLNTNTSRRQLGDAIGDQSSNLEGETFIFRDENGVDIMVTIENGKYKYHSKFYNEVARSDEISGESETIQYKGVDNIGNDIYTNLSKGTNRLSDATRSKVEAQLDAIKERVLEAGLNYGDLHALLHGDVVVKNGKTYNLKSIKEFDSNLKMEFGVLSHAVPVIGHDKVIFRVEKIMDNMQGLTEVNVHDLRTVMQRDNDGDHLFTHTRMPWSLMKKFANENGMKNDFLMFDREHVLNKDYINIFGVGENGKAGESAVDVGFHNYAMKLNKAKQMMGQVIGARNAISWLNRLGFKMNDKTLLKNLLEVNNMQDDSWKALDKFYDTVQNSLDIHGGIHEAVANADKLKDFLYFGFSEISEATGDPVFDKHNQNIGFFDSNNHPAFGSKRLQKEMFYEILRTLKKANMIQNDTWDERGSRAPEPAELRNAYYDLRGFFANPTLYLSRKLASKIGRMSDADGTRTKLIGEYMETFYGDTYDFKRLQNRDQLYRDIIKGRNSKNMKQIFSFDHTKVLPNDPNSGFDYSIGGYLIKELTNNSAFWDSNYEGISISKNNREAYDQAGFFVKNLESFVEIARAFGDDPVKVMSKSSISIQSFGADIGNRGITRALSNGVLRGLIHKQHDNLMGQIEYFRAERFANPNKVSRLQERLGNLQRAVDIMDQQLAKDMVIHADDVQYLTGKRKRQIKFKHLQKGQKVAVYRLKGDVKVLDADPDIPLPLNSLAGYSVDGSRINYGQLEFIGYKTNTDRPIDMFDGYSYIIDRKPKQMLDQSSNESRYAMALFKATYGNDTSPEIFIKENASDFRDDVRRIRAAISSDYIKTVKNALSKRVLSEGIFALQDAQQGRMLNEFMETWLPSVKGSDPETVLLRYILQPQITPGKYYQDANGNQIPAYKTNQHLFKTILQWAVDNGNPNFVKDLVGDIESYVKADGKGTEVDISGIERAKLDTYDYSALGDMANPYRTLSKHLNTFFSSPILIHKLKGVISMNRSKVETVTGPDGRKIPVRRGPKKNEYFNIAPDNTGRDC